MKKLLFIFSWCLVTVMAIAQGTTQYTVAQLATLKADLVKSAASGNPDVFELTTPGGAYQLTASLVLAKSITIRAAGAAAISGAAKPVLSFNTGSTNSTSPFFKVGTTSTCAGTTFHFEGLELDGLNTAGIVGGVPNANSQPVFIQTLNTTNASNISVYILNCYAHDFRNTAGNGFIRHDGNGCVIDVQGSAFNNCAGRILYFNPTSATPACGNCNLLNNTFSNTTATVPSAGNAIVYYKAAPAGTTTINHCTFYNFKGNGGTSTDGWYKSMAGAGTVSVTNSIFDQVVNDASFPTQTIGTFDYCVNTGGSTKLPTGTNMNNNTPLYDGAATFNFGLTSAVKSLFRLADNSYIGNTSTYLVAPSVASGGSSPASDGFTANWTAVSNATSYDVNVYTSPGGILTGTSPYTASGQATASKIITGLSASSAYTYKVTAKGNLTNYSDSDPSAASSYSTIAGSLTKLTNPSSLSAGTITTTGFTATWTGDAHASSYDVKVYTSPGGVLVGSNHNTSVSPLVISSLTPNTLYTFSVTAKGDVLTYSDSDPISSSSFSTSALTKLGIPTAGAASNYTATGFTANWATVAYASSYTVVVKQGTNTFSTTTGINQATNSLAITGLTAGLVYTYTVTAIGDNATAYSDSDPSTSPSSYSSLTPVVSVYDIKPTGFTASWSMTLNATNYTVKLYQGGDLLSTNVVTLSGTGITASPSYVFTGLYEGLPYTFTVTSYDGTTYAESASGSVITLTPTILENFGDWTALTPAAAINFSKTLNDGTSGSYSSPTIVVAPIQSVGSAGGATGNARPSVGRIQFSGNGNYLQLPLLQNVSNLTVKSLNGSFNLQSSTDGSSWNPIAGTTTANSTTVVMAYNFNLSYSTSKYIRLTATSGSSVYIYDLQVNPALSATKLTTPSPLSASDISLQGFTAKWSAVDNALGYYVKIYNGSTLSSTTYASGQATSSLVVSGLPTGITYTYKVIARGNTTTYLSSDPSSSESVTTLGLITPVVGVATSPTSSGFTANWSKVANAIGYDVQVYLGTTLVKTSNVSGQATESLAITGLSMGTTYTYKVVAKGNGTPDLDSSPSVASAIVLTSAVTVASINTVFSNGSWGATYTNLTQPVSGSYPTYSVNGFDLAVTDVYSSSSTGPKGEVHTAYLKLDKGTLGGMITLPTVSSVSQIEIHANNVSTSIARTFTLQQYISGAWTNIGDGSGSGTGLYDLPITQAEMIYIIPITANNTDAKFRILNTATQAGGINIMQIITRSTTPILLAAPTAGVADAITSEGFTAHWSTGDGNAQGYKVFVYSGTTLVNTYSTTNDNTLRSLAITGLTANTAYTYKVLSIGNGDVDYSDSFLSIASAFSTSNTFNITGSTAISTLSTLDASSTVTVANSGTLTVDATKTISSLTINAGGNATLNAGISLIASTLNINSDATHGTATFVDNGGTLTATTTNVQQYLGTARNWYVSSPVSNAIAPSGYSYYKRDEAGASWTSSPFVAGDAFVAGTGYVALPDATNATMTFTTQAGGKLNTGDVPVALTWVGASAKGFNLIGNPYPSHLSWTKTFTDANNQLIEPTIWYRTNAGAINNSGQWSFQTYNAFSGEGLLGGTEVIPPMQSFWVKAIASGTMTLDNKLTRSHQSSNPLKAPAVASSVNQKLRLQVTNGISLDEALIYFNPDATNNLDAYDSPKMTNGIASIPEIYTLATSSTEQLAINGMSSISTDTEIPLGFTTGQVGTFTI